MKPEQWRLDLYQDLFTFAPYNADLARAFVAIEHDPIPEEDEQGRRRVEGFKLTFEGVVRKGRSYHPRCISTTQTIGLIHRMDKFRGGLAWCCGCLSS